MTPWTPSQLLLKYASGHKSFLGISTSCWADGQVHGKAEAGKPRHLFIHSLGEEVRIRKFHLIVKFRKTLDLINTGIVIKKKSSCEVWKCFLKHFKHFVLILLFQLTGKMLKSKLNSWTL